MALGLERTFGRPGAVRFVASSLGGIVAELSSPGGRAVVALQGAQVLSWVPAEEGDVLWLSPLARLGTGQAVRGGIPICWPWFGAHPRGTGASAHGFVRAAQWQVVATDSGPGQASLTLDFTATPETSAHWPHAAHVSLDIAAGKDLTLTLSTRNLSPSPFALTEALHTYFAVGDISKVEIGGLEGSPFIDTLAGNTVGVEHGPVIISREVDRIYQDQTGDVVITDRALGRRIRVAKQGSRSTVVWNPWIDKSRRLGDMDADGYRRMVCVETAEIGENAATLQPGDASRIAARISVERV